MNKNIKEILKLGKEIGSNKKFQIGLTVILFLIILISSTMLRVSNLPILKDATTGLYTSNDLDSLYFYRVAETQLTTNPFPAIDALRSPGYNVAWIPELIDNYLVWNYQVLHFFNNNISFNYAATISAPIFYSIGLILFFILCLLLTKSKTASLISSAFLAYAPSFLFRSIAGFYDHDHVGVFVLFMLLIATLFAFKKFEKSYVTSVLWGIIVGFFTALVLVSWGGVITFVLVFFPIASLFYYLFNHYDKKKFILFYSIWALFSVLFTPLLGSKAAFMYERFLDSQGIIVLFVLGYAIIDLVVTAFGKKLEFFREKYHQLYVFGITFVLGILSLIMIGKNPLALAVKAWATLIYPFFGDFGSRLSSTVAENSQPYLTDLISQNGNIIFWFFILGLTILSINLSKNSKNKINRVILSLSVISLFFAVLFSRYSSTGILNGENFISQGLYLIGGIVFLGGIGYVYSKEKFTIDIESILLFALAITVVINARAAIRSFFLIAPFIMLFAGYGIFNLLNYFKCSKEETIKNIYWLIAVLMGIILLFSFFGNPLNSHAGIYQTTATQAKYMGASANDQWQNAMSWTRNNTNSNAIFVHWWDYGYFVQTLGKRATVTDGGHSGGNPADHYIGRYILTTPNPATAYSFMKTWNVSYLLIDPTDMSKYGAFSKIGSNDSWDRISQGVASGESSDKDMQETSRGVTRIYNIGTCVDEDITYQSNGSQIFLPGISITKTQSMVCNSYLGAIIVEMNEKNGQMEVSQPWGVYVYQNRQYRIPIKNLYFSGKMISFDIGLNAVANIIPRVSQTGDGKISLDRTGAMVYLSPRVFNSLLGKVYVLNDPYNEYAGLKIADSEDNQAVKYFKQIWGLTDDFIYFGGLQAPLKIWKVDYPLGTITHKEFFNSDFTFGGMDKYF